MFLIDIGCRHCDLSIKDINDRGHIEQGFEFTRDMASIIELYDTLTNHGTIDIMTIKNSAKRGGLTGEPMDDGSLDSIKRLPVLHSIINMLKWFEHACHYLNARLLTAAAALLFDEEVDEGTVPTRGQGRKKKVWEQGVVDLSRDLFRLMARDDLGLPLDQPGTICHLIFRFLNFATQKFYVKPTFS